MTLKSLPSKPILDSGTDKSTLKAFIAIHALLNQMVKVIAEDIVASTYSENVGEVKAFARKTAPDKFLKCNGQTIGSASSGATARANADTQTLFELLWGSWDNTVLPIQDSAGAASTRGTSAAADFGANKRLPLPDLRGEFARGWDDGRGADSGRVFGSGQMDALQQMTGAHDVYTWNGSASGVFGFTSSNTWGPPAGAAQYGSLTFDASRSARTAAETRPRNVALLYCIRYAG